MEKGTKGILSPVMRIQNVKLSFHYHQKDSWSHQEIKMEMKSLAKNVAFRWLPLFKKESLHGSFANPECPSNAEMIQKKEEFKQKLESGEIKVDKSGKVIKKAAKKKVAKKKKKKKKKVAKA